MKGQVHGSLYTDKFLLSTPSSVYENHLLNATIDASALPASFVGVGLLNTNSEKKVVAWLE